MASEWWTPRSTLLGLALLSAALLATMLVAGMLLRGSVNALDPAILRWVRERTGNSGPLIAVAQDLTAFGNDATLRILAVSMAGYFAAGGRWADCVHIATASAVGGLGVATMKAIVHRARPEVVTHLVDVHSLSFPSGHATNSSFVYGSLALIAARNAESSGQRRFLGIGLFLLVVLIGSTRVVLGVHWPTDVLTGWLLGSCWAVACDTAMRRRR